MQKLRIVIVTLALSAMAAMPALAQSAGCRSGRFVGSYTLASPIDVFGDGSVSHTYVFQLTLHADGTAEEYWTGLPDYMINFGTGSPWIGSWGCRKDGKLVVTTLRANYLPIAAGGPVPPPDIELVQTIRSTYLFKVTDDHTLTRVQARGRYYTPDQDPTDPSGGVLQTNIDTTTQVFKRLAASDADLLLP